MAARQLAAHHVPSSGDGLLMRDVEIFHDQSFFIFDDRAALVQVEKQPGHEAWTPRGTRRSLLELKLASISPTSSSLSARLIEA